MELFKRFSYTAKYDDADYRTVPGNHVKHYLTIIKSSIILKEEFRRKASPLLLASTQNWAPWSNVSFVTFWKFSDKFISICSLCCMLNPLHVNARHQIPIPNVLSNCPWKQCLIKANIIMMTIPKGFHKLPCVPILQGRPLHKHFNKTIELELWTMLLKWV